MRWPLRYQIVASLMVVMVLITLVGTTWVNAIFATRRTQAEINEQLQGVVDTLAESRYPLTDNVLAQVSGFTGADFAISDRTGTVSASSFQTAPIISDIEIDDKVNVEEARTIVVDELRYYRLSIDLDRDVVNRPESEILNIYYPQSDYRSAIRDAALPPVLVGSITFLIGLIVSFQIASRVTRPIRNFRDHLHELGRGQLEPIPVPKRNDEIRDLIISINELAKLISAYEADVRASERLRTLGQLGAGMAHQLRNSVTGCQLALDLHSRDCPRTNDETWNVANQQLKLMEEYLNRFLSIGRLEATTKSEVDLRNVVDEAVALTGPIASHASVRLEVEKGENEAIVMGDFHALCQMLINLILNAIEAASREVVRQSPTDGLSNRVRVTLNSTEPRTYQVSIYDTGVGPSPDIADSLFDPLTTDKPEGTGLGLSVARDVASAHQGTIHWERVGAETCFSISIPSIHETTDGSNPDH